MASSRAYRCLEEVGSAMIEFVAIAALCASALVGCIPVIETALSRERLMRDVDAAARALLIGSQSNQAEDFARAYFSATQRLDKRSTDIRWSLRCLALADCLTRGGLVEINATNAITSESVVIDMPGLK